MPMPKIYRAVITQLLTGMILASVAIFGLGTSYVGADAPVRIRDDSDSVRGSLLVTYESIAYSGPEKVAHNMKLEIMTEYFLEDGDRLEKHGVPIGHISLDGVEGIYFLEFSMLRLSKDFTTIAFRGNAWHERASSNLDRLPPSTNENDLVSIAGKLTYSEPIIFNEESNVEKNIKKGFIQITLNDESGQRQTRLISKESIGGATSIKIVPSPNEVNGKAFLVQTANDETFVVFATDPKSIQLLTDNFHGLNNMFVIGELVIGDGGFNSPWSWHIDPDQVTMTDFAIELCDGTPSDVENNLPYWLFQVEIFCPWSSKVIDILA